MSSTIFLRTFLQPKIVDTRFFLSPVFVIPNKVFYSSQPLNEPKLTFTHRDRIIRRYTPYEGGEKLEYYRRHLVNNGKEYLSLFIPENLPDTNCPAAKLLKEFKTNGQDDGDAITELNNGLQFHLKDSSYSDLLDVMYNFSNLTMTCTKEKIYPLLKTLDHALLNLPTTTPVDVHLKFLDVLFFSQFYNKFSYTWRRVRLYCHKAKTFTPKQVVHLAYLLTRFSTLPANEFRFGFQKALNQVITKLNLNELGLIFLMLGKIRLPISHPEFYKTTFDIFANNIEQVDGFVFSTFSEALLVTQTSLSLKGIAEFENKILPYISLYSLSSFTNIALSGVFIGEVCPAFFEKLLCQAKSNIGELNNLTMSRLIFMCAALNVKDEEFLELVVKTLSSQETKNDYRFVSTLRHLLCLGYREENLIREALSQECVKTILNRTPKLLRFDLDFIDNFVEVNMPEYQGPRLTTADKKEILMTSKIGNLKDISQYVMMKHNKVLAQMESTILSACGPDFIAWKRIGACYQTTAILRFNKDLEIQKIPEEFIKAKCRYILRPPDDGHFWTAFLVSTKFTRGLDGNLDAIITANAQHFEAFGYKPVVVDDLFLIESWKNNNMADSVIKKAKEVLASLSST